MAPREGRHAILDGKVQLYLRSGSPNWQCACSVDGHQHRANTGEDGLTRASMGERLVFLAEARALGSLRHAIRDTPRTA